MYDYHIHARDKDATIHPDYFIIVDQPDWDIAGILMVYLNVSTEQRNSVIGVARVRGPLGAECIGMNLDVANMNWEDVKYTEYRDCGGEDLVPISVTGQRTLARHLFLHTIRRFIYGMVLFGKVSRSYYSP